MKIDLRMKIEGSENPAVIIILVCVLFFIAAIIYLITSKMPSPNSIADNIHTSAHVDFNVDSGGQ